MHVRWCEERLGQCGCAPEEALPLGRAGPGHDRFEELPDHAVGEVPFELGGPGTEAGETLLGGPSGRLAQEGGLPQAGDGLDEDDRP
jgi:hypothetical protein